MRKDVRTLLQIADIELHFAKAEIRLLGLQNGTIDRVIFHVDKVAACLKTLEEQSEDAQDERDAE
jgi:hypothetical protein